MVLVVWLFEWTIIASPPTILVKVVKASTPSVTNTNRRLLILNLRQSSGIATMTLNTQLQMSIEHKFHRIHHQHHHFHFHHIHHLLHQDQHDQSHLFGHQQHLDILNKIHKQQTQCRLSSIPLRLTNSKHNPDKRDHSCIEDSEPTEKSIESITNQAERLSHQVEKPDSESTLPLIKPVDEHGLTPIETGNQQQVATESKSKQKSQIQFLIFAALAYILSPIDLIPEAIFGLFGIIDDVLFLFTCLSCIAIILIYPLFVEVRRALFDKLGLKRRPGIQNK